MTRAEKLRVRFTSFADAMLLTEALNQYYISGFRFADGFVVVTKKSAHILTDSRYAEAARAASPAGFEIHVPGGAGMLAKLRQLLLSDGVETLAFEEKRLTVFALEKLKGALPGVALVPSRGIVETLRRCKDPEEIEKIARAQKITDDAFSHILKTLTPDMTESEVAVELEYFMRRHGAEDKSFDTIAVSGRASALPHGVPRNVKLETGFLTMDFGCVVDGYHSDMTRTVVLGRADAEMKRLYATVLEAQQRAIQSTAVGEKCAAVDKRARDCIELAGYRGCFGHSLGHSVGLEIHEAPNFAPRSADCFENGNVITVEPGIYLEGQYGCRIEDMICAQDGAVRNLTGAPKELIELF